MKLDEIEKMCEYMQGRSPDCEDAEIAQRYMPKLLKIAKAARDLIKVWDRLAHIDLRAQELEGSCFDPRFKPEDKLGLKELIAQLFDVSQTTVNLIGSGEIWSHIAASRELMPKLLEVAKAAKVINDTMIREHQYIYGAEILDKALDELEKE